jgi:hypothetical protein
MKRFFTILIVLSSLTFSSLGQKENKFIVGTWELAKEENEIKTELSIIPIKKNDNSKLEKKKQEILIRFNNNLIADIKQNSQKFTAKYSLQKDKLILGTTEYKILKLDSDSMIIVPDNQIMPTTYHYFKSKVDFKPDKP